MMKYTSSFKQLNFELVIHNMHENISNYYNSRIVM